MYKRQELAMGEGGDNRTFAFWGKILVPAVVVLVFRGFLRVF